MSLRSLLPLARTGKGGEPMLDPFFSLHRDINRAFEDVFRGVAVPSAGNGGSMPKLDVRETNQHIEVSAELPGVDEKDVDLELVDDVLTIKGEKRMEKEEKDEKAGYHMMERGYGAFARSILLPFAPEADKVTAQFAKGILKITCPKPAHAAARNRKIQIHGG